MNMSEYHVNEGNRVCHIKESTLIGTVTLVDRNIPHPTTCHVRWDGCDIDDIQWTNKLLLIDE